MRQFILRTLVFGFIPVALLTLGLAGCGDDARPTFVDGTVGPGGDGGTSRDGGIDAFVPFDAAPAEDAAPVADSAPPGDATPMTDAGGTDAGIGDAGGEDAGTADAGDLDAGSADAGSADAGSADAGSADAGRRDSGTPDAGIDPSAMPLLSEVFYDAPMADDGLEWVELYNPNDAAADISGMLIAAGGGAYTPTLTFPRGSVMPARACWVVGGPDSTAVNHNPAYARGLAIDLDPNVQNSGTLADAVALFLTSPPGGATPVDAVIYGPRNSNTNGLRDETGDTGPGNVDVEDAQAGWSIQRTGATTWERNDTPTPGNCRPASG